MAIEKLGSQKSNKMLGPCSCESNITTIILIVVIILSNVLLITNIYSRHKLVANVYSLKQIEEFTLFDTYEPEIQNSSCSFWDCINLYRCSLTGLTLYVYPLYEYVDGVTGQSANSLSQEYFDVIQSIVKSPFYTKNPNDACLLLPSIDLLSHKSIRNATLINRALGSLDHWDRGTNHILFNMIPGNFQSNEIKIDGAVVLGAGLNSWSYRRGYDISIPLWSSSIFAQNAQPRARSLYSRYLLAYHHDNEKSVNYMLENIALEHRETVVFLKNCAEGKCNILAPHQQYEYPGILAESTFCLIIPNYTKSPPDLLTILAHKCIPVLLDNEYIMPFEEVIDWSLASIKIAAAELPNLIHVLNNVTIEKIWDMQKQIEWLYEQYFRDLDKIIMTTFEILESRIFPYHARTKYQWNSRIARSHVAYNPLFLPIIPPKSQGFTAVILTYDRLDSLTALIHQLSHVPSLQSILVIWNNQKKPPPNISQFGNAKPIQIIHTLANKLSNRFYPYSQIVTEAVLTIDDDIVMLTADELEFGYEVWREFPDRIVGFPSRVNIWNNDTQRWQYESEWTNQVSMVLTGAAFHHKFWNHMYTYSMPGDIKEWVDEHMNCEDIAMNFLVSNITRKPPIKVTPRKKFKCPECTNNEMLSADLNHMKERSNCIDRFALTYGRMPLRSVEFRADPVLYRDSFPEKLKRFNDIGSL